MAEYLSICIPTYNRARLLESLLASLRRQVERDPAVAEQVAFYFSDNASPDNTPRVIEAFKGHGLPVSVTRNDTNIGIRENVLKAYTLTRGRYTWVLGDDEILDEHALANILPVLRRHEPGLLVALNTRYPWPVPERKVFANLTDYARECARVNPHILAEHTLCSSNIVRSDCYDPACAREHIELFLGQMFGLMKALHARGAPVVLADFPVITVREARPNASPADGEWSALDKCWIDYLGWLKAELQLPELDPTAPSRRARDVMLSRLRANPLKFLINHWRALFQPSAWRFLFTRLFGVKKP
ncbi:MAG: glycosyltransferase family 2 protein [Lentisphaerae bacterium]|nr:glycosyltransferase family 2 protein [Lentisphaerota bacterium]